MKKVLTTTILLLTVVFSFSQQQTFDLTTFTPPKNWKKQTTENAIQFTKEDAGKGIYCLITLYKAVAGTANSKENFDLAWESLVKEMVTVSTKPEMQPAATENGWEAQSGFAPFESDGNKGIAILVTSSGFEKMANIVILTNTDTYEKEMTAFLESISLEKQETPSVSSRANNKPKDNTPVLNNSSNPLPIAGKWARSVSLSYNAGGMSSGYTKSIYDFKSNNTYTFTQRTWGMTTNYIYIVKETGILKINNNQITLIPQKSVIESWTHNGDALIKLTATNKRPLETMVYQYIFNYDDLMKDWNLVLQANKETLRDGKFGGISPYPNGWFFTKRFSDYDLTALKIK